MLNLHILVNFPLDNGRTEYIGLKFKFKGTDSNIIPSSFSITIFLSLGICDGPFLNLKLEEVPFFRELLSAQNPELVRLHLTQKEELFGALADFLQGPKASMNYWKWRLTVISARSTCWSKTFTETKTMITCLPWDFRPL